MSQNDVLLLTLHKQHYLDHYRGIKIGNYSCMGYYDAITVTASDDNCRGVLTTKKSNAPFSNIWYTTGKQVKSQEGGYSNQNIGLFRNTQDEKECRFTDQYWELEKALPFFVVGFLKLGENVILDSVRKKIEDLSCLQGEGDRGNKCLIITYVTFDNADLVMFLKGSSLTLMHSIVEKIDNLDEVIYVHSIVGIEEQYLIDCYAENKILENWQRCNCCIDEPIARICFRLASSGGSQILSDIKAQWDFSNERFPITGYENTTYSYISGHGSIAITLEKTDVKTLLSLMLPGGFMTHGNPVYDRGLYNIETDITIQEKSWNDIKAEKKSSQEEYAIKEWCKDNIAKYSEMLDRWRQQEDEGMYSYYQALLQTLSMLDQYERFKMSRDIFALIYPSFKMFDRQLEKAIERYGNSSEFALQIENIKSELREYLECVNSVIYHTIHTDQVYLMIPGYSGTAFSIPIKCSLFYMWFAKSIAEILNDNQRQYSCILTPGMESKAITCMIAVDEQDDDKIVCLRLSQRHLYFPRNLMIILAHELGHYIGRGIRCRKKRMECMTKSLAGYIAEGICPEWFEVYVENKEILQWYQEHMNQMLQLTITELMYTKLPDRCPDNNYHAQDIRNPFLELSLELLSDIGGGTKIAELTKDVPKTLLVKIESDSENYEANMRDIYQIQRQIERNVRILANSRVLETIIDELIEIFQEVFCDVAAFSILEFGQDDFEEAFRVSEGMAAIVESKQHNMRKAVIKNFFENKIVIQTSQIMPENNVNEDDRDLELYLLNRAFEFVFLYDNLTLYAKACHEEMRRQLESYQEKIQQIRSVYKMFISKEKSEKEIYDIINGCIKEYKSSIWEEYLKN